MGIFIAAAVLLTAIFFRMRYRPEGKAAIVLFGACLVSSTAMALSIGTFSRVGILFYLAEIAICSLVVLSYRYEARRQAAVRAARKQAAAARAAQERLIAQSQRRSLSSYAAFTDYTDYTESVGEAA